MARHTEKEHSERFPVDFLGDISGPGGNVFAIFGAIKALGREYKHPDLLKDFHRQLDADKEAGRIKGTYEDVLDLIVRWFGPQAAINSYRRENDRYPLDAPEDAEWLDE